MASRDIVSFTEVGKHLPLSIWRCLFDTCRALPQRLTPRPALLQLVNRIVRPRREANRHYSPR